MSVAQVQQKVQRLEPTSRAVLAARKVDGVHPADEWLRVLSPLANLDVVVNETLAKNSRALVWQGVAFAVSLVGTVFAATASGAVAVVLGCVAFVVGLFFARTVWNQRRVARHDLPDRLVNTVMPVLRAFALDDPAQRASVALNLDLRFTEDKAFLVQRQKEKIPRGSEVRSRFLHPWWQLRTQLRGGISVSIVVVDRLGVRVLTRSSASGKTKTKKKVKARRTMVVTLTAPTSRWSSTGAIASVKTEVRGDKLRLRTTEEWVEQGALADIDPMDVLACVARCLKAIERKRVHHAS